MVRGYAFLTTLVLAASITAQTPGQLYDPLDGMDANGRIPKRRILTLVCALIPQPRKKTINYYGIFAPAAGRHGRVVP